MNFLIRHGIEKVAEDTLKKARHFKGPGGTSSENIVAAKELCGEEVSYSLTTSVM